MIDENTEQELKLQQNKMLHEFKQGLDVAPIAYNINVDKFVVPASEGNTARILVLNSGATREKLLIFSSLYTAFYLAFILKQGGKSPRVYLSQIVPRFINFLNNITITENDRANVLKLYETHRVKNDGVKTQSTGLKEVIYLLNKALDYKPYGNQQLSNEEYRYLNLLTKTKPAPSDDVEQNTLTDWFGSHLWLRRDDLGVGNDLYNRVASPKSLIKSFRITVETALLELHNAKHALIGLFKESSVTSISFPILGEKPIAKNYPDGKSDPNFKNDSAQHKMETLNYKREFFSCISSLVKQHGNSSQLEIAVDALIYSQCSHEVIPNVKNRFKEHLEFSQQSTINGKVKTVFKQATPNCLLFTTGFIMELLEYANNSDQTIQVPTCRAEHFLFASLMAYQTVAVTDIFRLKLSDFKFIKLQNNKVTHIDSDYFKTRAHAVHNTKMIDTKDDYGKAILAFITDRTAKFYIKDSPLVINQGISKLKTGSLSVATVLFNFIAESSLKKLIKKNLSTHKSTSVFVDGTNKILTSGIKKESFISRKMGIAQEWLICCETPCKDRIFGFESIKNTSIHSQSDTFDPTKLVNYRSHATETERSDYLNEANETWKNNCGRTTRSIMHDIEINLFRPSQSEKATYYSDFIKAVEFIEQRKRDTLARLKIVTQQESGRVNELGFEVNRKAEQGDLPDSMYLVESPETVMKFKHFLTELEYKHLRISQNAPDFLFYTALPTAEWIEEVFSQRLFSRDVVLQGEIMYKKFREYLPPLFVAQTGGV